MKSLPINSPADALAIGQILAQSGAFGVKSDAGGAAIALMCYQEEIGLLEFLRTYHVLDGKPTMRADTMLAKFVEKGWDYEVVERTVTRAEIRVWNKDRGKEFKNYSLTMDEVKEAGYCFKSDGKTLNHNWRVRPRNMLWARVVSDTVRLLEPSVVAGIYTPEEHDEDGGEASIPAARDPVPLATTPKPAGVSPTPFDKEPETLPKPTASTASTTPPAPKTEPATPFDPFAGRVNPHLIPFTKVGRVWDEKIGVHAGKKWSVLTRDVLDSILANPPPMLSKAQLEAVDLATDEVPF